MSMLENLVSAFTPYATKTGDVQPSSELPGLQLMRWITQPYAYLEQRKRREPMPLRMDFPGLGALIMFDDPEAIRDVFTQHDKLDASEGNSILGPFLGENSLLLLEGKRHHRHRRLLMPPLHGQRMRVYGDAIADITDRVTRTWSIGEPLVFQHAMQAISLKVIVETVFGQGRNARFKELEPVLTSLIRQIDGAIIFVPFLQRDLGPRSPGRRLREALDMFDALLSEEIAARRAHPEPDAEDIFSLMLAARDEDGEPLSDVELRDELLTMLVAGHETTATALSWAIGWLLHHPELLDRVRDELAPLGPSPDPDALSRLPYLKAVVKETLRLYPIVPIVARGVVEPITVAGQTYPVGTYLAPNIYLTHRNTDIYDAPDVFRPERFLEKRFSAYEYLPFGGGPRRCIGMAFALYEAMIVLATIVSRFDLELVHPGPPVPVRQNVTIAPKGGPLVRVTARRA